MQDNSLQLIANEAGYQMLGEATFDTVQRCQLQPEFTGRDDVQIDLSQLSRIDSAGLALLISWVIFAKKQQKSLYFVKIPAGLNAMIDMRGLRGILNENRSS